jgi:protocatechuate 3,4-dioxygenase beta subunit
MAKGTMRMVPEAWRMTTDRNILDDQSSGPNSWPSRSLPLVRRRVLQLLGGVGLLALVGCGSRGAGSGTSAAAPTSGSTPDSAGSSSATSSASATAATSGGSSPAGESVGTIPEETAGPFPGDGSNGANVLTQDGVVRRDIRPSFGPSTTVADGVPMTLELTVVDADNGGAARAGTAVYVWHCDREGRYSMYSDGVTEENYLRGVQEADADGRVRFTSIYPACYQGRWPHVHFEVYPSVAEATAAGSKLATSQIALTADVSKDVYATDGYEQSADNLSRVSLATDMVFSDGAELETPTVTGSVDAGYVIALTMGV